MNARAANPSDTTVDVWYPTGLPSPAGKGFPLVRWVCYRYCQWRYAASGTSRQAFRLELKYTGFVLY